ncbi:MAG: hypothetical protein HC916_14490 [Coleofasciculaceae cyanobacterium SM2_1_6]|nr:hypothetical protein [Coleofasciculaceae cyanobacterium SM2_1_6]
MEAPILENDSLFLESPGALGEGILGNNPPGQTKLEGQLKQNGSIAPGEVSNPEFLEASMGLPVGWTDPRETATATELDQAIAPPATGEKPSEICLTPESPNSRSIESSITTKQLGITLPLSIPKRLWISPREIEEVSFTQIRHAVDAEAIARYAELMRDNLWDFNREPLPVLFRHENRYLVGDGHHRIEAARKVGADIFCEIFTATQIEDALLYSIRAIENSNHGLPLRPKDQRKRIVMFLDLLDEGKIAIDLPDGYDLWSSRAIAAYLKLPESGYRTVASIRKERLKTTEEPWENWGTTPDNDTTETTTPPPSIATVEITTSLPTILSTDTPPPPEEPPLTDEEREELGLLTSLDQRVLSVINTIKTLENKHLVQLREAIENEEIRRLEQISKGIPLTLYS